MLRQLHTFDPGDLIREVLIYVSQDGDDPDQDDDGS